MLSERQNIDLENNVVGMTNIDSEKRRFRKSVVGTTKHSIPKNVVKGVKGIESSQVIAMMGNIKFKFFPVTPWQFAILDIES
jgi:hypothetical protein